MTLGHAAESVVPKAVVRPLDELVYRDGDRVRGKLIAREGDVLVFRSERFGMLRVPAAQAEVILAEPPSGRAAAAVAVESATAETVPVAVTPAPFTPLGMTLALRKFFGSWHGRFSFATEIVSDTTDRNSMTVEGRLQRKWRKNEVGLRGRYDFSRTLERTTMDLIKMDGSWRHDFPRRIFSIYRPTLEWNRAFFRAGVPADYVLLQQEVGAGVNLLTKDTRKLRAGLSENLFDVWTFPPTSFHSSRTIESVFTELEAKLPWRITISDRVVWYYALANQRDGWENRFELDKKLTETMTVGVRHEVRYNHPDLKAADYSLLRLMLGFDF